VDLIQEFSRKQSWALDGGVPAGKNLDGTSREKDKRPKVWGPKYEHVARSLHKKTQATTHRGQSKHVTSPPNMWLPRDEKTFFVEGEKAGKSESWKIDRLWYQKTVYLSTESLLTIHRRPNRKRQQNGPSRSAPLGRLSGKKTSWQNRANRNWKGTLARVGSGFSHKGHGERGRSFESPLSSQGEINTMARTEGIKQGKEMSFILLSGIKRRSAPSAMKKTRKRNRTADGWKTQPSSR